MTDEQSAAAPDNELVSLAAVEHAVKAMVSRIPSVYLRNECWRAYQAAVPAAREQNPDAMPWQDPGKSTATTPEAAAGVCLRVLEQVPDKDRVRYGNIMADELDKAERMFPVDAIPGNTYCANCGARFDATKPQQRYCTTACRASAWRKRKAANAPRAQRVPA